MMSGNKPEYPRRRRKPFYMSKKWVMAAIAATVPMLNSWMGIGLEVEELTLLIMPIIAYIAGEAWVDATH